jgi:hypothetical protein
MPLTALAEGFKVRTNQSFVAVNSKEIVPKDSKGTIIAIGPAWDLIGVYVALKLESGKEVTLPLVEAQMKLEGVPHDK